MLALLIVTSHYSFAQASTSSIEFADFSNPKRVGVDPTNPATDNLIIGFDYLPDGTPIAAGTIINSSFESVGIRLSSIIFSGPTDAQALDFTQSPNFGSQVAISPPNILSGVDPNAVPNTSGAIAGTATSVVTFTGPQGQPGTVMMVGAFNDLLLGNNTLTAYSGPNGSGTALGAVSATAPGDFFGLRSTVGIGSITFSGFSTEVDDLVFSPITYDASTLGGSVTRLHLRGVRCVNLATEQSVRIAFDGADYWDCETAGLVVSEGDRILVQLLGLATGSSSEVIGKRLQLVE
jgi:hypothetical protein